MTDPATPCTAAPDAPACAAAPAPASAAPAPARAAPSVASHAATDDAPVTLQVAPLATPNPHFALIGGIAGIARLVERFYFHMATLPSARSILAMHRGDLGPVKAVLIRYLTEWTGGPQDYSPVRGEPRLRRRHLPFAIGAPERDAWLDCMQRALADTVTDAGLRRDLGQAFARTADFIRNDQGTTHEHHRQHPARLP